MAAIAISKMIKSKKISKRNFFAIMFDKIPPIEIKSIIENFKNLDIYGKILFEASGNINENSLADYLDCGADVISMGSITNSAGIINMSLDIK